MKAEIKRNPSIESRVLAEKVGSSSIVNNLDLDDQAKVLAAGRSAYSLAREVLMLKNKAIDNDCVFMPKSLTSENGAKYIFIGEFKETIHSTCPACLNNEEDDEDCFLCNGSGKFTQEIAISWSTIKEIYQLAVDKLAKKSPDQ